MGPDEIIGRRLARTVGLSYDDKALEAGRGVLREVLADGWHLVRFREGFTGLTDDDIAEEWEL